MAGEGRVMETWPADHMEALVGVVVASCGGETYDETGERDTAP